MGLAGPKKSTKISHDPNNTKWTRDTSSFGHKIMTSQGWAPGELLGAQNAAHAEFHTEANASHIRVVLKDDNLGLGAKIGSGVGPGECTGLDVFQNLLGRLNGKDEQELEKEQRSREDLKRAIYTEQKWGSIRFVRGGFLVGDKIQALIDGEEERVRKLAEDPAESGSSDESSASHSEGEASVPVVKESKKSKKKRKAEVLEEAVSEVEDVKVKKSKKKRKAEAGPEDAEDAEPTESEAKKSKKKSKKRREIEVETDEAKEESGAETKKRKKDKKEKREKKEKKKEKRKAAMEDANSSIPTPQVTSGESTLVPVASSGRSTPIITQGRHAVRSRNIAAKRLAGMDMASLNQIFMIKSQT